MRKLITGAFTSLDGVMQAPGGPEEDQSGGFRHGGWVPPHWDDVAGAAVGEMMSEPYDLLLGRRTYDIFAAYWPNAVIDPAASDFDAQNAEIARTFNRITKYVATHRPESLDWQNSEALGPDVAAAVRDLKKGDGPNLLTQGSTELLQILLAENLIDELRLFVFPIILGKGKRLFGETAVPSGLKLVSSSASPNGVVMSIYRREGGVDTGSFALEQPGDA